MNHKVTNVKPCKNPSHKKRSLAKIIAGFLGVNLLVVSASGYINVSLTRERVAEITQEEKKSIMCSLNGYYTPSEDEVQESYFTYEYLEHVTNLTLDMNHVDDLSGLAKYPNLSTIAIANAQELTDRDLDYLKNSPVKSIALNFDSNIILSKPKESFDIGKLSDKELYFFPSNKDNELDFVILCSFLKNINEDQLDVNMKRALDLSRRLDQVVASLDLNQDYNPKAKFLKILKYVTDRIEYDPNVQFYGTELGTLDEETYKGLVRYYNIRSISCILDGKGNSSYGVCANYTDLLTILSYKSDLTVFPYSGGKHAWNVINLGDGYQYVDATGLDNDAIYEMYCRYYFTDNEDLKEFAYDGLCNKAIRNMNEYYYSSYTTDMTPETFSSKPKDVKYCNQGLDGTYTYHNVNWTIPLFIFYLTSLGYVAWFLEDAPSLIRKREKKEDSEDKI